MLKNYGIHTAFIILFLGMACATAVAQDSGSPSFETYDRAPLDPSYITGGGDSTFQVQNSRHQAKRDSIAGPRSLKRNVYKPSPVVPKQPKSDPNDDSILSFNFLYYLIQKYKMQDIVD